MKAHPYRDFLHLVRTPSRYIGGEFGTCVKRQEDLGVRMVLVFPDAYEVGMSHLGSQILYHVINREPDLSLERSFAPWPDLEAELRKRKLPLVSLETFTPLRDFDVVGFSLQHELSYTNVLNVLDLAGIPLHARERGDEDPIVLGGGPCALHPAPLRPFFDAFFIGEAELALPPLLREIGEMRRKGLRRAEVLERLHSFPGLLVPSLSPLEVDPVSSFLVPKTEKKVVRQIVPDLDLSPVPPGLPIAWSRAIFDRQSVEIARGCTEGCRFCEAGYTYRPVRDRRPIQLMEAIVSSVIHTGVDEVSLCSLSPADSPILGPLVQALSKVLSPKGVTLSVSSLRAYGLDEEVLRALREVRTTGLTLAPEAGSERLRAVINKNVTDRDLIEASRRAFGAGWQRLKLYFMIGLPTETDEDVRGIARLAKAVLEEGRKITKRARVVVSVGLFVPRPHTPFQWEGLEKKEVVARRIEILRKEIRDFGIELKVSDPWVSFLECVLARGDEEVSRAVERAFGLGCRFDSWTEMLRKDLWEQAFRDAGVDPERYTCQIPIEGRLPWDDIDCLVERRFLVRERERAYRERPLPPCEKPASSRGLHLRPSLEDYLRAKRVVCFRCGSPCDPLKTARARAEVASQALKLLTSAPCAEDKGDGRVSYWHIVFAKVGRASWLSQRDMVAHLPRILRRAGLEIDLSKGFHPTPKITYRPPLPVGYQGVGEWVVAALRMKEGVCLDLEALNKASVEGVIFRWAIEVKERRPIPGPSIFVFRSPKEIEGEVGEGASYVRVEEYKGEDPLVMECLEAQKGGHLYKLEWPPKGERPDVPLHTWLSGVTGIEFMPSDFVRLYDDPYDSGIQGFY